MKELRQMREKAGISQSALARQSGVDRATINKIEHGKRTPGIETLMKLAAALDAEIGDFFPKAQAPLPFEIDGGRGLQLWRQHASDLADDLEELAEGAEALKWERRFGRAEGAAYVALGTIGVIETLLSMIEAGEIPASREEVRSLLRAGFRLAKSADRIDELAAPNEEDLMRGVRESHERTLTEIRFRKIVEGLELTAQDRKEIFA